MSNQIHTTEFKPFTVIDFRTYTSTEWMHNNQKKYRQVFEKSKLQYIYVELSLINKLFERENWMINVHLRCYKLGGEKTLVCELDVSKEIHSHESTVYIREGWGNKSAGKFWKKGRYVWEAHIDDQKVTTKSFYVEDVLKYIPQSVIMPLKVTNIQFFEDSYDKGQVSEDRRYYTQLDVDRTRYVFVVMNLENRIPKHEWTAEIFIKFYSEGRDLKGELVKIEKIRQGEEELVMLAGWGSNVKGSWRLGSYTVELIYQDQLLATSEFEITNSFVEGQAIIHYPASLLQAEKSDFSNPSKKAINDLNQLIGLHQVKKQIYNHTKYLRFVKLRKDHGFQEKDQLLIHSIFRGNPGTGKTTVARLLGGIYHNIGILERGHVHEVSRVDLVGEYIGQTAPKVKEAIEKARGGVLFIDEAYSLARSNDDTKDFGREVIELLIKEMSHPKCDFMVVAAGYTDQMDTFIDSNPGLASRFKYYYDFPDYEYRELLEIMKYFCQQMELHLSEGAFRALANKIQEDYRNRKNNFGNARYLKRLLERAKINMAIRLMDENRKNWTREELQQVILSDVHAVKESGRDVQPENMIIDQEELNEALTELNALVGMAPIKKKILELVDVIRFRVLRGQIVTNHINLHTVLIGNPGTGKTTVTRICARIFKALGVLSRGHIVETDRQGLVAGFVGQTAIKTAEIIKDSMGGLLFIDEAYALLKTGAHNDFGDEAIQILLKKMEDERGKFFVFVAGYPKEMDSFLNVNPGLKSRFDIYLHFEDFVPEELTEIAKFFVDQYEYKLSHSALTTLSEQLTYEYETKDNRFGNARTVRSYIEEIIRQQNIRVAKEDKIEFDNYGKLLKKVDVIAGIESVTSVKKYRRQSIGF